MNSIDFMTLEGVTEVLGSWDLCFIASLRANLEKRGSPFGSLGLAIINKIDKFIKALKENEFVLSFPNSYQIIEYFNKRWPSKSITISCLKLS
jgi:hypothetical protein